MKRIVNNKGVALVTSLIMTMISLMIVLSVLYMITQGIKQTGTVKRYKTALEASYGGADIYIKEIVPKILSISTDPTMLTELTSNFSQVSLSVLTSQNCLYDKLRKSSTSWDSTCSQTINPKQSSDMTFKLQSTGGEPYTVYTKIVDTLRGNTEPAGYLEGAGVAESQSVITPQTIPTIYRIEIQAERGGNTAEKANLSVLFAN